MNLYKTSYNIYLDFWSMTQSMNNKTKCMNTLLKGVHTKSHTSKINVNSVINSKKNLF